MQKKVLLTGVSGWIGKHTAIELLKSGYNVLGTVRDEHLIEPTKETIGQHASTENLSFAVQDLLNDGWDDIVEGCNYVIHIASPYPLKVSKNINKLIPVAKDGTIRVLKAALKSKIEQIVLTSSFVAMIRQPNRAVPFTFGENDWTDISWKEGLSDYHFSKTIAEKSSWDFVESNNIKNKLTTINPGGVFGEALDTKVGTSIEQARLLLKGKYPAVPKFQILVSDVKDVAKSHVACLGNKNIGARRLIVGKEVKSFLEISKIMAAALPDYAKKLPKKELPSFMVKFFSLFDSNTKIILPDLEVSMNTDTSYTEELLDIKFKPAKISIENMAKSVVKLGLA